MCCRTRYALKGVVVIKEYRHFDQVKRVEKSPKAKQYYIVKKRFTTIMRPCAIHAVGNS